MYKRARNMTIASYLSVAHEIKRARVASVA